MHKRFNIFLTVMMIVFVWMSGSVSAFAAEAFPTVDTITLDETMIWDSSIPVDLGWKISQDQGKWIEELGISKDVKSLILVLNRSDREESRLFYFSKGMDDEWNEVFSVECMITENDQFDKNLIHGIYEPVSTFGTVENPGSLLPYRSVSNMDEWSADAASSYGMILHPAEEDVTDFQLVIQSLPEEGELYQSSGFQMPQEYLRMMIQSIDADSRFVIL